MKRPAFICLLVWALAATAAPSPSQAQPSEAPNTGGAYRVQQWTTAQGLPQGTITDIVLLPNGELWLATFGGLARFDGNRFHVVDVATDDGLAANRVVSIAPDGADSLWLLTQQGHLGRLARGRASAMVPPASPTVDAISLFVHGGAFYCQLTDSSIWRTDGTHPWRRVFGSLDYSGTGHAFAETEDGEFWLGWGRRLVRLEGESPRQSADVPLAEPNIFPRASGGLWVALDDGLATFVGGRLQRVHIWPPLASPVTVVEPAGDGAIWVGMRGGVSHLQRQHDGSWRQTALSLGIPARTGIRTLRTDATGSLLVGTDGHGLLRVSRHDVRRLGRGAGLADVGALATDGEGGAFVTGGCLGLFHIRSDGETTPIPLRGEGEGGAPITECGVALAPAAGGGVWARASTHLFLVSQHGRRLVLTRRDLPEEEGPIVTDAEGALWVVSRRGLVTHLSSTGSVRRQFELPPPLVSAAMAPDGALWIGSDGQVFRVDGESVQRYGPECLMPRGLVRDMLVDRDGTTWIASYGGGLGRLRDGRVARVTAAHGLPDNSISRLLEDGHGRLWISTNRGLVVTTRQELESAGDGAELTPVVLGPERGVEEANFGSPAGFADAGGQLWFGTIDGAVVVDAAAFPFRADPPVVRLERVSADGRDMPVADVVPVPALTSRVHVEFSSAALLHPERARFRFRADGREWVGGGAQPWLDWTPPGPGRHRLLIDARNEDGVWSAGPTALVIDVPPAWWQTVTLRATVAIGVVLAAFAAFRRRVRAIERRHAERVRVLEDRRRAEERVSDLRAQLEHVARVALAGELAASLAHEVSQPIGAIINNAEAGRRRLPDYLGRPQEMDAILGDIVADGMRASEVVRGLRSFLRPRPSEVAPIDLSAVVREVLPLLRRELGDNRVTTTLALAEHLPPVEGQRVQLGQVVVNLVMNACEALAAAAGDRHVTIETAAQDARVRLSVRDNGPGLDQAVAGRLFEPFVTTKPGGLGMGLAICRAIAEAHGGHLAAGPAAGGGVQVTLSLPSAPGTSAP